MSRAGLLALVPLATLFIAAATGQERLQGAWHKHRTTRSTGVAG